MADGRWLPKRAPPAVLSCFRARCPAPAARTRAAAPPPAPPPSARRLALAHQHAGPLFLAGMLEARPPLADVALHLAALAAQPQEVVARAKARMLEQAPRPLAEALQEARLHGPDFHHVAAEAMGDRELLALRLQHPVHRGLQRRHRVLAPRHAGLPRDEDLVPHQRREQESG